MALRLGNRRGLARVLLSFPLRTLCRLVRRVLIRMERTARRRGWRAAAGGRRRWSAGRAAGRGPRRAPVEEGCADGATREGRANHRRGDAGLSDAVHPVSPF